MPMDQSTVDFLMNYENSIQNRMLLIPGSFEDAAFQLRSYNHSSADWGELRSMTRADKTIINSLTMLAADSQENYNRSSGIVQTVEQCIKRAPPELKLVPLYLMDSIVKNVRGIYTRLFMQNLTESFCDAFVAVDQKMKANFIKLLQTWGTQSVFPPEKNAEIHDRLKQILTNAAPQPPPVQPMAPPVPSLQPAPTNWIQSMQAQLQPSLAPQPLPLRAPHVIDHSAHMMYSQPPPSTHLHMPGPASYMQQPDLPLVHNYPSQAAPMQPGWVPSRQHIPNSAMPPHTGSRLPAGASPANAFHSLLDNAQQQIRSKSPDVTQMVPTVQAPVPVPVAPAANTAPRTLKAAELDSRDVADVVKSLYDDHPHQCKSDGRRFKTKEDLEKHLDRLFAINKARKDCTGVKERHWFSKAADWASCADIKEARALEQLEDRDGSRRQQASAKSKPEEEESLVHADEFELEIRCRACNEKLDRVWHNLEDVWVFPGCVRVGDQGLVDPVGKFLVHQKCYQPGHNYSELASTPRAQDNQQWVSVKAET